MYRYVIKRIFMMIPVMLGVVFIVFFILNLTPGCPAMMILGEIASPEAIHALREEMGLNDPIFIRFFRYLGGVLQGDLGISYRNHMPVLPQILERFPNTVILATSGMVLALLIGIPIGILSAKKQYSLTDNVFTILGMAGISMPSFFMGLMLVLLFALHLGWLPSAGMGAGGVALARSLVLPTITIGTSAAAIVLRMTRSSMLEVIRQDYIDTVRAKGVAESKVVTRHMLKNAMVPIVTAIGLQYGMLLGGAAITETIFAWPGLGRFMIDSIRQQDTPLVLGSVLLLALMYSVVNLFVDLLYAFVDPRIKSQYKR